MIVKRIIEKLRSKGYDDFYLADLAEKYEGAFFFFIFFIQLLIIYVVVVGILALLVYLLPQSVLDTNSSGGNTSLGIGGVVVGIIILVFIFCIFCPPILSATIKDRKRKGETDLRITYIVSAQISKIGLKAIRYAPVISTVLLVASLIFALIQYGFNFRIIFAFAISLLLLRLVSRPYYKLLSRVKKEASYYVDWKTHQIIEHFDERYSGYEIWRIPSSEMDFEEFNVYYFRNICQATFVSVSIGCLSSLIYLLSLSPMLLGGIVMNEAEIVQSEQLYEGPSIEEAKTVQTAQTQIASNEKEEYIEGDVTQEDWEDALANEENDSQEENKVQEAEEEQKQEGVIEPEEETVDYNNNRIEYFALNQLDEKPTMSDGTPLSRGVVAYLREQIPELEGNYAYVEYKISPMGEIIEVDASLVNDRELRGKIRNSLYSMPNVNPGKKDGRAVYVWTNITVER